MKCIAVVLFIGLLSGCASSAETEAERWGWLQPGQTRLEDVLFNFGTPNSVYDNERILVYKVYYAPLRPSSDLPPAAALNTKDISYAPLRPSSDLVFLFDENGVLRSYKTAEPLR